MKYLYGASVQGIQSFILETNKLREIAGASEFVEQVCTRLFEDLLGFEKKQGKKEHPGKIIGAAGNIRYILDENECENVIRCYPKSITEKAPGIVISQAAVLLKEDYPAKEDFTLLEERLEAQRNLPAPSFLPSWMAVERSRRTGLGAEGKSKDRKGNTIYPSRQEELKNEISKKGSKRLLQAISGQEEINSKIFPLDIDEIAGKNKDNPDKWIAVMHADGNGLGQLILKLMKEKTGTELFTIYREFSKKLDAATKMAAAIAFRTVFPDLEKFSEGNPVPIRPILLGGDDITLIIKANKAMLFTRVFIEQFEQQTQDHFKDIPWDVLKKGLTIKAGIAYVKPSYPFHFAISLAEDLCKKAKEEANSFEDEEGRIPSCLMFHQVQSSFIGSYKDMAHRELSSKGYRFDFGPYFLQPKTGFASISEFKNWYERFQKEDAPGAQVRALITEYVDGRVDKAEQYEKRLRSLNDYGEILKEVGMGDSIFKDRGGKVSPALDIIKMAELHK